MFTTLRYFEQIAYTIPASNTTPLAVRYQTSVTTPGLAGGHQPYWRDQMALMYNRYRVHGMRYKIMLGHANTSANAASHFPCMWAIKESNTNTITATTVATWNTLCEQNDVRKGMVGSYPTRPVTIKGYMPVGKPWGLTKSNMKNDDQFWADMVGSPAKMSTLMIYIMNTSVNTIADSVVGTIEINYLVELSDRIDQSGS